MYDDAARFYDVIHKARGRNPGAEADLVIAEARRLAPHAATLLDVGCGTGAHLPRFSQVFDVVGVDLSPHMLAIASRQAPNVPLVEGDFRSFELDRTFDVAVSLFSGIGYLVERADLEAAVAHIADHLNTGGALLIEGWVEPDYWIDGAVNADSGRDGDLAVARAVRSSRQGMRCEIEMRYAAATPEGISTVDEQHTMRISDPNEFAEAFAAAGLSFERLPHMLHGGRSVYAGVKA
ncbi:MAG TPA: class I SAM-dependent methyltransferase [Acidimicrobiales bacterium]|nr:class I SAM-dependent methyltransferase [Acidimicrobiales bacterium]